MKRSTSKILGLAAAGALVLSACGASGTSGGGGGAAADTDAPGGGDAQPVKLTVTTTIGGPDTYHNIPIANYLDAVKEASGGAIDYEFTYANGIVPPAEVGAAVGNGTVDLALVVTSYNPAEFPVSNWLSNLAFAGEAGPPAMNLERSAAGLEWWWTHEEERTADFTDQGLMPLTPAVNAHNAYQLLCTSPVTTLEEAKGKSVRTPGTAWADTAAALGMEAVSLPGAEMYEALQRGIVDCVMADAPDMLNSQLVEVATDYTAMDLPGFTPIGVFMNQATWDKFSTEQQQIFWDQIPIYIESLSRLGVELQEELLQTEGVEFHTPEADLADAVQQHQAKVLADAVDNAPAQVKDPQEAVDSYVALHEKWSGIVIGDLGVASSDTWSSWVEGGGSSADIDFKAYGDRVVDEVLKPHRP